MFNYKKLALFLVFIMLFAFVSCNKESNATKIYETEESNSSNNTREYSYIDGVYMGDVVTDEKTAKEYSDIILKNTLDKDLEKYEKVSIALTPDNYWVVNYVFDGLTLGGGITVTISKNTGEVIGIVFGE